MTFLRGAMAHFFILFASVAQLCPAEWLRGKSEIKIANLPITIFNFASPLEDSDQDIDVRELPFLFDNNADQIHPLAISKPGSLACRHGVQTLQYYQAFLPEMTSLVLNIEANWSNGVGGLTLALEVPSPCDRDVWIVLDSARCSEKYACALRLPAHAVARIGEHGRPRRTHFRTRVINDNENYVTDVLRYNSIKLDYESVVVAANSRKPDSPERSKVRHFHFDLSQAMASGSLQVIPDIIGASANTRVTMRLRQKDVSEEKYPWAKSWRHPSDDLDACALTHFEVVADGLFVGHVEMEVEITGDDRAELGTVMVASRVGLAQAETRLLESVLKAHSHFFLDPENIIHGLPMTTIKPSDPGGFAWSNPTEWGFILTSWAIMAELRWLTLSDAAGKISGALRTMDKLQSQPEQFAKGLFFPYYNLRKTKPWEADYGKKLDAPARTNYLELPCGDNALLYSSLTLIQGWLLKSDLEQEAALVKNITSKLDFSLCMHRKQCPDDEANNFSGERAWAVAMTVNSETESLFPYDWNVWADEGGVVGMAAMLSNSMSDEQFHSMVKEQQTYSPCETWQNITVANTAYFNSVFTLPTRSFLGLGTLFSSPTFHDFSVRSVLPTFRAHRATKRIVGDDFFGPSDAMSQSIGSVAFFPPNTQYRPCSPTTSSSNKCTWCDKLQYFDSNETHHLAITHGSLVSFLAVATMETPQVVAWIDDLKGLMTDVSGIYNESYGFEVLGPNRRTPMRLSFIATDSKSHGNGFYEALAHSYTSLSMYEGMAAVRRRFELLQAEGAELRGPEPSANYRPLSDFLDAVPQHRERIDALLDVAKSYENKKICQPSDYGPSTRQDL